jgi:tetratricopeptide (TPR) repeat protein
MQKPSLRKTLVFAAALVSLAAAGCSPKAKKTNHLADADRHYAAGQYDQAEIEYKNVLQIEPTNPKAIGQLGRIYFEQTRVLIAKSFLKKASELEPTDLDLHVKLGLTDLAFRDFAAAKVKAELVLDKAPLNPDAPLILAQAATTPALVTEARTRLKGLTASADSAPVLVAMGILDLRENKPADAEAKAKSAIAKDPKSADAHALLGALHLVAKNPNLAEPELKLAAELAPARSAKRIEYAQFKISTGDTKAAREMMEKLTKETPDYLPAWMLLAQMASVERKYDESLAFVGKVLARDNTYPEAQLLSARLRMAKGEFPEAVKELEKAIGMFPSSPQFLYQLGLAYVATNNTPKAIEALNRALGVAPGYTDASVLLAGLNLRIGDESSAIGSLKTVVQKHPELIQPRLLLADAYRAQNNLVDALAIYELIEKDFPGNARTPLLIGTVLAQQKKLREAREAFDLALKRDPKLRPATEQLITLDVLEKQFPAARKRIDELIANEPKSSELYFLLARFFGAQNDSAQAETALQKSIELNPDAPGPYFMMAQIHLAKNDPTKALASFEKAASVNPKDTQALLMVAMINEQQKRYDAALAAYEKILTLNPKSGIALNNIAVLYAERLNQLDKGLEAAQKARELFPREPNIADTLGWLLVKKRQLPRALVLLQESADKLPKSAEIKYHLGTVHYLLGNEESARAALEECVKSTEPFTGIEDAKKLLALLLLDTGKAGPEGRKALEAALSERPDDTIALVRLAALHERDREPEKAIARLEAASRASPTNVKIILNMVRLHTQQKELPKALELAKAARKLAPNDPETGVVLGRLAYSTRDYTYAYGLLQEAARRQPENAEIVRDFARSAYSLGKISEAQGALRDSLAIERLSAKAIEAQTFLDFIGFPDDLPKALAASAKIEQRLKTMPTDVPALMAAGSLNEQKRDTAAAIAHYEKVLEQFPDFNPAKRRLAIIFAANQSDNKKALEFAMKARPAFPDDQALAKAFGIILYRENEFSRALVPLRECANRDKDDAELAYYLGMTQFRVNDRATAKKSLERAVSLKLDSKLAAEAQKTLAEIK